MCMRITRIKPVPIVQRSEMFGKLVIVIITLLISTDSQEPDDTLKQHIERNIRNFGRDVRYFLHNIGETFSNILLGAIYQIEGRRIKIKNGLNRFIDESIIDRPPPMNKTKIPNVHEDPEMKSSAPRLITMHGYKVETHTAVTQDNYVISLHRILPESGVIGNKAVLFLHGLLGSCDDWLILGPNRALPYLLVDAGYDVWLANARGTQYSNTHTSWSLDSFEFWNFSVHEIGLYDLSTAINYIKDTTEGKVKIHFVGHSMGTTALLILLSMNPAYNSILTSATLLAPLAIMYHAKGPLRFMTQFRDFSSYSALGDKEFLRGGAFPQEVMELFCTGEESLCLNPWLLMANGGKRILNERLKKDILSHVPAMSSTKTIIHYGQLLIKGQFLMFDYGPKMNTIKYGSRAPPKYNLERVTVPLIIFSAKKDWLSTVPDVSALIHSLRNPNPVVHHIVTRDDFSHTDFVWGEDAPEKVYEMVITILFKYNLIENYKDIDLST